MWIPDTVELADTIESLPIDDASPYNINLLHISIYI